jgi:NADH-quinone oxidoreductase subunit L
MTVPLGVLALLTIVTGWVVGIPGGPSGATPFASFLAPVFPIHEGHHGGAVLLILSILVVAGGFLLALYLYKLSPLDTARVGAPRTPLHAFLANAWYFDRLYDRLIVQPLYRLSEVAASRVDLGVIDGIVNGVGRAVVLWAGAFRRLQSGYIVNYALTMLVGAVVVIGFFLAR